MIRYKPLFTIAISLLVVATISSISFPHTYSLGERLFQYAGVATETKGGLRIVNISIVIILLLSIVAGYFSFEKFKWYAIIIMFIIFGLPSFGVSIYQKFFADGIYTVAYNSEKSYCDLKDDSILNCELYFLNQSSDTLNLDLSFIDIYNSNKNLVNTLNRDAPYKIEVPQKDKTPIKIKTDLANKTKKEISELKESLVDQFSYSLHISIQDKNGKRDL